VGSEGREIQPKVRLCIQFLAGIVLLAGIFHWEGRGWPMYVLIPVFPVFVVGTANYYNFMDGINGIAGITGVIGLGLLGWFAAVEATDPRFITLSVCMSLACLGFLPFNMPTAKVFMGDVGSILLGLVFAGMVVWLSRSFFDFVCGVAFLFPFYADELTTLVVRIKDGELPEVRGQRSVVRKGQRAQAGRQKSEDGGQKCGMAGWLEKDGRYVG